MNNQTHQADDQDDQPLPWRKGGPFTWREGFVAAGMAFLCSSLILGELGTLLDKKKAEKDARKPLHSDTTHATMTPQRGTVYIGEQVIQDFANDNTAAKNNPLQPSGSKMFQEMLDKNMKAMSDQGITNICILSKTGKPIANVSTNGLTLETLQAALIEGTKETSKWQSSLLQQTPSDRSR